MLGTEQSPSLQQDQDLASYPVLLNQQGAHAWSKQLANALTVPLLDKGLQKLMPWHKYLNLGDYMEK